MTPDHGGGVMTRRRRPRSRCQLEALLLGHSSGGALAAENKVLVRINTTFLARLT